jgi:acetyl-CoA carboxylase/biotin carboxylase 1
VLIANDITHEAGSFGTQEDMLFHHASLYARARGLPRVYLAANSGARIGLAREVMSCFKAAWVDESDVTKGYHYLYVSGEDAEKLRDAIVTTPVPSPSGDGSMHHQIVDIIGQGRDLGVENLRGSGCIAGETVRAYEKSFTLTYVTGRTVGIGAYLVRLGQRTIQKASSAPIILTGHAALNKLIGSKVYSSNAQLGGPKVMYRNGVSHQVVSNDLAGCRAVLRWLSYVPRTRGAPLPHRPPLPNDPVTRPVQFTPSSTAYDPRHLIAGQSQTHADGTKSWVSGFFDRGSWTESLAAWAQTVVVGRARLGGLPIGVIIAETRSVTSTTPADPAAPDSQEQRITQAGQVWYPDSAYKTAQALRDFHGEGLPVMIFANWRGFSGGQRDMFDEVLKFGSYIVEALVAYTRPVFVYIPPAGELRGGAWVVVDPTINMQAMEMYAAPSSRGGVLEPSGLASIKFKRADMIAAAHRLDSKLKQLDADLAAAADADTQKAVKAAISAREAALLPVYVQLSHSFADLHDTPGRMLAKGAIRRVVEWRDARRVFAHRLRRRLMEMSLVDDILLHRPDMGREEAVELSKQWLSPATSHGGMGADEEDEAVVSWIRANSAALQAALKAQHAKYVASQVVSMGRDDPDAVVTGVFQMLRALPSEQRDAVLDKLRQGVLFG